MSKNHNNKTLVKAHKNFEHFISIIHDFSISVNDLSIESDVYWLITKELAPNLELVDCVIYEVNEAEKSLIQVAAVGEKIDQKDEIRNRLVLNLNDGHVGMCYEKKQSLIIRDVSKSANYIQDVSAAGSEIVVPIMVGDEVMAILSSESPDISFYNESHRKLIEVIAIIASGAIQRIRENRSLQRIKSQLEEIVHQKSTDLNRVIETISTQYSELKYQHGKMELLLQEVHHRVNNNLQIVSSLLNLYSTDTQGHEVKTLTAIRNRVQAMALIHQNIYKSVEMSTADVEAYVRDLMNHLRSVDETGVQCVFDFNSSVKFINLNTLVPLGLLLVEIFSKWMELCQDNKVSHIDFDVVLQKEGLDDFSLVISDNSKVDAKICEIIESDNISAILISALVEQLEGEISAQFSKSNKVVLTFREL